MRILNRLLILIINCEAASSRYEAEDAIMDNAANCPAEVLFVSDIMVAAIVPIPVFFAAIPSVNDTARYPAPMGIASRIPCLYAVTDCFILDFPSDLFHFCLVQTIIFHKKDKRD